MAADVWVQRDIQLVKHERCRVNMCDADELVPGGRRSSILSSTSVKRTPPHPCASLLIWGIHLHYSATLRLYRGFRMRTSCRKRHWREMVNVMTKEGHIFLWCMGLSTSSLRVLVQAVSRPQKLKFNNFGLQVKVFFTCFLHLHLMLLTF